MFNTSGSLKGHLAHLIGPRRPPAPTPGGPKNVNGQHQTCNNFRAQAVDITIIPHAVIMASRLSAYVQLQASCNVGGHEADFRHGKLLKASAYMLLAL